jgi:hypothetical protein
MLGKKKVDTKKLKNNPPKRDIVYQPSKANLEEIEEDGPVLLNSASTRQYLKKKSGGAGVIKPLESAFKNYDAFGSRTHLTVAPSQMARINTREDSLERVPEMTKAQINEK